MAYNPYNVFKGELDGHSPRDFQKLDYSLQNYEERKKYIEDLLNSSDFFVEYFDDKFKVNINSGDALSDEINIVKIIENMANYLLNSEDVKEEDRKNKPVYVFHKSNERFDKKINRESISIRGDEGLFNIVDDENIIHSLDVNRQNSRLPKTQKITRADLKEDSKCGEILRDYQVFLDLINRKLKEKPDKRWRYYSNAKAQVQDDMINVKNSLKGIWGFNIQIKESTDYDLDVLDFTDMDTVEYMMRLPQPSFEFNFEERIIWNDFNDVVKKAGLTVEEEIILQCLQQQWKIVDIAEESKIDYDRIRRTVIPNIAKKIIKVGCKYDAEDPIIANKIKDRKEKAKEAEEEEE